MQKVGRADDGPNHTLRNVEIQEYFCQADFTEFYMFENFSVS